MIAILAIHNTDERNRDILAKMKKRYTFLTKKSDNSIRYTVMVIKLGTKLADLPKQKFDRVYFHKDSVKVSDITEYVVYAGSPQVLDFRIEEKDGKKTSNKQSKNGKVCRVQGRRKKRKAQGK